MRILIVDDSPVVRTMLTEMLDVGGHAVVGEAENLAGALELYKAQKPDLVTLDLSLEHEDGLSILKALRALDPTAKVLIISANTQKAILEEHSSAGAAGVLAKPFKIEELLAAVKRLS